VIGLEDTFRCDLPPRHIWVVVNDPQACDGRMLMVNMTTLRDSCVDEVCILGPQDYELLTHATTIAYSRAMNGPTVALENLVKNGQFLKVQSVPTSTLDKIIAGARTTTQLSPAQKRLLPP